MLLILINWFLTAYISFTIGFATRRIFIRWDDKDNVATCILWGFFVISTISTALLFFTPAGPGILALFFVAALLIHLRLKDEIHQVLAQLRETFRNTRDKVFAFVLLFCLLALSAQSSKINDDGFYYIQTMLWFSDVGFVKGISNLLLPLGLGSSWHILQAVFSFDFIEGLRLNDLNGFLVLTFYLFCIEHGANKKENTFLVVLLSAGLLVSIPFLSAPSPDLPVILLTAIAFYLAWSGLNKSTVNDVLIFAAFGATIKLSAVALILLAPGIILFLRKDLEVSTSLLITLVFVAVLTIGKNIYQTGYPFFPYPWFGFSQLVWTTPFEVMQYYAHEIKSWGLEGEIYRGPASGLRKFGLAETIQLLWSQSGIKGLINKFLLIGFPLISITMIAHIRQGMKNKIELMYEILLLAIFATNFLIWLMLAPQYRFILPVYLFFGVWFLWIALKPFALNSIGSLIRFTPHAAAAILLALTIVPVSINLISTSSHIGKTDGFQLDVVVKPHVSYSFSGIDTLHVNGQSYFHVQGNSYCWDSPLPCMSAFQHSFLQSLGYELNSESNDQFILLPK